MNIFKLDQQQLGPYALHHLIGKGGMSAVYSAEQLALGRPVAIKILRPDLASNKQHSQRFNNEARIAASLQHQHIVPIYDFGQTKTIHYIVMQLLEGGTLLSVINQHYGDSDRPFSLAKTSILLHQLSDALDYAHEKRVIHRDIKPNNIMFDSLGKTYLVDFGIATLHSDFEKGANSNAGTAAFMAPELWRNEPATPAVDQYALGLVIYALLTGKLPFDANTKDMCDLHLHHMPRPLHELRPDAPRALDGVLERAIAKDPAQRFPTVTEFAQAFLEALQQHSPTHSYVFPRYARVLGKRYADVQQGREDLSLVATNDGLLTQDASNANDAWMTQATTIPLDNDPPDVKRNPTAHLSPRVIVCRREGDMDELALPILQKLQQIFGESAVLCTGDIPLGTHKKRFWEDLYSKAESLVVLIGEQWLAAIDQRGGRLIDRPFDDVRIQLEAALTANIQIIPVTLGNTSIPDQDALPPTLQDLVFFQGMPISTAQTMTHDLDLLINALTHR